MNRLDSSVLYIVASLVLSVSGAIRCVTDLITGHPHVGNIGALIAFLSLAAVAIWILVGLATNPAHIAHVGSVKRLNRSLLYAVVLSVLVTLGCVVLAVTNLLSGGPSFVNIAELILSLSLAVVSIWLLVGLVTNPRQYLALDAEDERSGN